MNDPLLKTELIFGGAIAVFYFSIFAWIFVRL